MKRRKTLMALAFGALTALPTLDAHAGGKHRKPSYYPKPTVTVPELSVAGAGTALLMVAGGLLVAAGKRRKVS